jgi:hypothetical protein
MDIESQRMTVIREELLHFIKLLDVNGSLGSSGDGSQDLVTQPSSPSSAPRSVPAPGPPLTEADTTYEALVSKVYGSGVNRWTEVQVVIPRGRGDKALIATLERAVAEARRKEGTSFARALGYYSRDDAAGGATVGTAEIRANGDCSTILNTR